MFKAMLGSTLHPILVHILKIKKNIGSQMGQTDKKIKKKLSRIDSKCKKERAITHARCRWFYFIHGSHFSFKLMIKVKN
jgi:hypothetical protein